MLSRGLGLELVRLTAGSFPRYLLDIPRLVQFSGGGMIATENFDASPENIQLLETFVDRWVVHIRDPAVSLAQLGAQSGSTSPRTAQRSSSLTLRLSDTSETLL